MEKCLGACLSFCTPNYVDDRMFSLQLLPPRICSHVLDYMTGDEIFQLVKLDPWYIGKQCVTLEHVAKFDAVYGGNFIEYLRRCGKDMHVPSNQRLLRLASSRFSQHENHSMLCDLCHANDSLWFCWYWGLMKCRACSDYHEQHDEYEIERFPGIHHPWRQFSLKKGPRKYFVRWAGKELLARFEPVLSTRRLATHGGWASADFHTICVLENPATDPYTGEPCGPLMTHQDIDEKLDKDLSPNSIKSLVASLDLIKDDSRLTELGRFAEEQQRKAQAIADEQRRRFDEEAGVLLYLPVANERRSVWSSFLNFFHFR